MAIFVDTNVLIGYFLEKDAHHQKCVDFVNEKTEDDKIHVTRFTAVETLGTYQKKLVKASVIIARETLGMTFDGTEDDVRVSLYGLFDNLRAQNPNLENFLTIAEKASADLIFKHNAKSLDGLLDWFADSQDFRIMLEKLLGCEVPGQCPSIERRDAERVERISNLLISVSFKDSNDKKIFCETVVIHQRFSPLEFYTVDSEFASSAKEALELMHDNREVKKCSLHFLELA